MGEARDNLNWIDSITVPKKKFDALSIEEQKGVFPTGILHHDTSMIEYCEAYNHVIERAKTTKVH